ncbi:SMI1/KNR4 family protein [Chryseobacterium ginsenosidimutans]|uniref:SMI1/KNR4 family protein n=1 Tax=Chryseobacterium ginsenosidimutans TaxID=687846 RepID=UPI0031E11372
MENKEFNLKIIGTPTEFGDIEELENYKFPNGKGFPDSYKKFVLKYGYGLTLEEFHIYLPMGDYGDSLFVRTKEIKSTYIDDVNNDDIWFDIEPDGSPELLKRLFPFASSDNGLYLFWDYESETDQDEFDIYLSDFRGIGFRKVGKSLYELIENLTNSNYKSFLSFSTQPLGKEFKCLNKID